MVLTRLQDDLIIHSLPMSKSIAMRGPKAGRTTVSTSVRDIVSTAAQMSLYSYYVCWKRSVQRGNGLVMCTWCSGCCAPLTATDKDISLAKGLSVIYG